MSKYTTQVRFICEAAAPGIGEGFDTIDIVINAAAPYIFNFSFPIFDAEYRRTLENKILRHFYTREICEETVGLWKLRLCDRLNIIMPYYNQLYQSTLLQFNPLYDIDVSRTHTRSNEGSTESSVHSEGETSNTRDAGGSTISSGTDSNTRWDLFSDTPQGGVAGINAATDSIGDNTYLTNARKITDNGSDSRTTTTDDTISDNGTSENNTTGETSVSNLEEYTERVFGKTSGVSYSKMVQEFRKTFLNIDAMIIDELEDLFFGLWE